MGPKQQGESMNYRLIAIVMNYTCVSVVSPKAKYTMHTYSNFTKKTLKICLGEIVEVCITRITRKT